MKYSLPIHDIPRTAFYHPTRYYYINPYNPYYFDGLSYFFHVFLSSVG